MTDAQSENGVDESSARDEGNKSNCNKDTEQEKKKIKNVGIFGLFRFSSYQDHVIIIVGLLLATLHAIAMPVLLLVFGIAVRNFADNHHTGNYFQCLNEQNHNCSAAVYCSRAENDTNCCIHDQFDCVSNDALLHALDFVTLYCIIIAVIVFFSGCTHSAIFHYIGDRQMFEIRKRLFRSIILQDVGWFDVTDTTEITSKMTEKLDQLEGGLGECLSITFQTAISVSILIIQSFYYEWHIAFVLLVNWPIAILAGVFLQQMEKQEGVRKDEDNNKEKLTEYAEAGAIAEEMLSAIHTVTSYGGQSIVVNRYGEALEAFRKAQQRKILFYGALYGIVSSTVTMMGAIAYWFGGWAMQELNADFTNVVMAFICVDIGFMVVAGSATDMDNLGIAQKAAGVIFDVIDTAPIIDVTSGEGIVPPADHASYDITFNNVTFSYPSRQDTTVLKDLSLKIQSGQTVALVGTSGSGKSTAIQLIQRFYDVDSGELLIGGHNIRKLNLHWLRQHIGVVSQEPVLFATTIAENIRYGNDDVTQEEIEAAAKMAYAHSYIIQLPEGYETLVGERGTQLSGGQKQRIAIARALIKNPRILLLDEATSALDTESEATVQAALDEASVGRTTVIIAHRLSTIKRADIVAVIEDKRVIEIGTQTELLAQEGRFYKLMVAQLYGDDYQLISKDEEVLLKSKLSQDQVLSRVSQTLRLNQLEDFEEEGREMLDIIKISCWQYLLIAVIASFVEGSLFTLFSFIFLTVAVKSYLNPNTAAEDLYPVFIWIGCIAIALGSTIFSKGYFFGSNGGVLVSQLRRLSLQAMLRQEIGWFDLKFNWTGALVSKLAIDASLIQNVVGNQLGIMISSSGAYICIIFLTFVHLNASAASIILVTLLPLAISPVIIRSMLSLDITESVQLSREESNHIMFEGVLHIRTVKSFNLHEKLVKLYEHYLTISKKDKKKYSITVGCIYALVEIIQFVVVAIMLRFGAFLVTFRDDHKLHTNFIYVFIPLLATIYASGFSKQLGHSLSNYLKAKTAVKTIFALLYRIPEIDVYSNRGLITEQFRGEVSFNDVAFAYPTRNEVPIFRKINFSVIPGETLAIVGSSGCGKSTVTSLLERFYDPVHGVVWLDKTDIKLFNIQWLRRQIGLVSQEPILFDATIADNIRFGANFREVTDDEIEMAAKTADIHEFIMNLPQGYDTKVGPKGGHLSGGQKQRIAIARALVRDPKILLLDEATSALDTESEKIVEKALRKAQAGRTCIKIAHRISTVCNADKIIVINDGQVVESGTHAELITLNGLYCRMNDISK